MKLLMIVLFLTFIINSAFAKTIRVAVIDSGLNMTYPKLKLCKTGHANFTKNHDNNMSFKHGANISNIINDIAKDMDYCQIIIKALDSKSGTNESIKAFEHAFKLKVDIINYSGGGKGFNFSESHIVKKILNSGIYFVTAAGNNGEDLGNNCNFYPACYDKRIIVVGNKTVKRKTSSNYGSIVDYYRDGTNVLAGGYRMTGSSQSTAIITGEIIKNNLRKIQSETEQAINALTKVMYIESGLEKNMTKYGNEIKEQLPQEIKDNGAIVLTPIKIMVEQKITWRYKW